jgi:hypothetical protein
MEQVFSQHNTQIASFAFPVAFADHCFHCWNLVILMSTLIFEMVILNLIERVSLIVLHLIQFPFTYYVLVEFTNEYSSLCEKHLSMTMHQSSLQLC